MADEADEKSEDDGLKDFVEQVMQLQRRYAHEKRNIITERRAKLREIIQNFAITEISE